MSNTTDIFQKVPGTSTVITSELMSQVFQAFDDYPDRIYVKDSQRRFTYVNKAMLHAAKYRSRAEMLGRRDEDLFILSHLQAAREDDERLIQKGSSANIVNKLELETWHDERLRWVWTTKIALVKDGTAYGIFGISRESGATTMDDALQRLAVGQPPIPADDLGVYYQPPPNKKPEGQIEYQKPYCDEAFLRNFPAASNSARFKLIHKDDRELVSDFLSNAIRSEAPFNQAIEFRVKIRNSEYRWVRGHGIAWGSPRERLSRGHRPENRGHGTTKVNAPTRHLLVAHHDVTEQRVRENLGSRILEAFPGYVFVKDANLKFKYMNSNLLQLLRLELSQVRNKNDSDLGFIPAEIGVFEQADRRILNSSDDFPVIVQGEALTIPGTTIKKRLITIKMPISSSVFEPWNKSSTEKHVLGLSWDITNDWQDMQRAVLAWRALLIGSPDAIYVKDKSLRYTEVNAAFAAMFGLDPAQITGRKASEIFASQGNLLREIEAEDTLVINSGKSPPQKLRTFQTNKGLRVGLSSKIPIKNDDDTTTGILGISRDISRVQHQFLFDSSDEHAEVPKPRHAEVAILCWRLCGCAELAEKLAGHGDVLIDFFSSFYEMLTTSVTKSDLRLDHLSHDRAMLIFGALDDFDRLHHRIKQAGSLALELLHNFNKLVATWNAKAGKKIPFKFPLRLAIGIDAGKSLVAFVRIGRLGQISAFGNTIEIANQLADFAAKPNSPPIIVSSVVREKTGQDFTFGRKALKIPRNLGGFELRARRKHT